MRLSSGYKVKQVHLVVGVLAIALNAGAGGYGAWCWRRALSSPLFWRLLRAGQAVIVVQVALGGLLVAFGHKVSSLHLIYGLLPLAVSFIAEQLRISSAQLVLDQRGHESAAAVGELPEDQQRSVVMAIVQRETGVMVLATLVVLVLLVRAASVAG
jgi:hypothetical protein